jgi:hypothetical protein
MDVTTAARKGWELVILQALRDAIHFREASTPAGQVRGPCAASEDGMCEAHEEPLSQIGLYRSLARELGLASRIGQSWARPPSTASSEPVM